MKYKDKLKSSKILYSEDDAINEFIKVIIKR